MNVAAGTFRHGGREHQIETFREWMKSNFPYSLNKYVVKKELQDSGKIYLTVDWIHLLKSTYAKLFILWETKSKHPTDLRLF